MTFLKAAGVPAAATLASLFLASFGLATPVAADSPQYALGAPYRVKGRLYVPRANPNYDRIGTASWYGGAFHGRRTANGERFNMHAMTAAHPTLPLSTLVRVTNLDNGRSITVRINDRGPFARGRIIDLSRAGARALGFEARGTTRVRVAVVDPAIQTAARDDRVSGDAATPPPIWE